MSDTTARAIFSGLCLVAMLVIAIGGVLEILRQTRGESLLRPGQFRLRIFSALVWIILLGALSFAVAFLWPYDKDSARKFASVVSGALILLVIALLLLAYDVWQTTRQRQLSKRRFDHQLEDLAREEIAKIQAQKSAESRIENQEL
jgi:type VI protein secretion system component VasK